MQAVKISRNFWAIISSRAGSNKYVIQNKDFNVLVDPGLPDDCSQLSSILFEQIQLNPADIHSILLTHAHPDHSGAVPYFRELSGADILVHQAEVPVLENLYEQTSQLVFKDEKRSYKVKKSLNDGDFLLERNDDLNWTVLHTPGHTRGSICLYNEKDGLLITGDTVFAGGSIGRTDLDGGDSQALVESITRLSELEIKGFFPGHMDIVLEKARESIYLSLRTARWFVDPSSRFQ